MSRYTIRVRKLPDGTPQTIIGREAWALEQLLVAGEKGITSLSNPAPRLAHYIFKLRRAGFVIETIDEGHGGAFAGTHARYILRSAVEILADEMEEAA